MGWQLINSVVKTGANETNYWSYGYLKGEGNEEGFFCFQQTPYFDSYTGPIISDEFLPHIEANNDTFYQTGIVYNGNPVYCNRSTPFQWIFKPYTRHGDWVLLGDLREPVFCTDIDEVTVLGDKFYEGSFPYLNSTANSWEITGAYDSSEAGSTIDVQLVQDVWKWDSNGDKNKSRSGLCGKYQNEDDGTWKFVGIPTFSTSNTTSESPFKDEVFKRAPEKDTYHNLVYNGSNGHTITYDRTNEKWVVGEIGRNTWSESASAPSVESSVSFTGYKMNEDQQESDSNGNFTLSWAHMEMGDLKKRVYMGEVSLWRQ